MPTLRVYSMLWCCNVKRLSWTFQLLIFFMQVGIDPRPVMREAYRMFKDGGDPEKVVYVNFFI